MDQKYNKILHIKPLLLGPQPNRSLAVLFPLQAASLIAARLCGVEKKGRKCFFAETKKKICFFFSFLQKKTRACNRFGFSFSFFKREGETKPNQWFFAALADHLLSLALRCLHLFLAKCLSYTSFATRVPHKGARAPDTPLGPGPGLQ